GHAAGHAERRHVDRGRAGLRCRGGHGDREGAVQQDACAERVCVVVDGHRELQGWQCRRSASGVRQNPRAQLGELERTNSRVCQNGMLREGTGSISLHAKGQDQAGRVHHGRCSLCLRTARFARASEKGSQFHHPAPYPEEPVRYEWPG
ncbi:Os01g0880900, partial [Oryza sativa Japonica Group]